MVAFWWKSCLKKLGRIQRKLWLWCCTGTFFYCATRPANSDLCQTRPTSHDRCRTKSAVCRQDREHTICRTNTANQPTIVREVTNGSWQGRVCSLCHWWKLKMWDLWTKLYDLRKSHPCCKLAALCRERDFLYLWKYCYIKHSRNKKSLIMMMKCV